MVCEQIKSKKIRADILQVQSGPETIYEEEKGREKLDRISKMQISFAIKIFEFC